MSELPFASAEGVKKIIDYVNRQTDRVNALAIINVELVKLLIESGSLDREKCLHVFDEIARTQSLRESEEGARYTQLLRGMIETQTEVAPSDKA